MESATENNRPIFFFENRVRVKTCGKSARSVVAILFDGQTLPGARQNRHVSVSLFRLNMRVCRLDR